MKILDFGSANIDYVYSLDHIVLVGETLSSSQLRLFPGGKGLNQAISLSRAGVDFCFAGAIGTDGQLLEQTLTENNVDIRHLMRADTQSGHAIIQVSRTGENSIFVYSGANGSITTRQIDEVLSHYEAGDMILLQNELKNLPYIIGAAFEKGMCIILNPSPISPVLQTLDFGKLSYIILNEVEIRDITGMEQIEPAIDYLLHRYPKLKIMLTLGKDGCVYADATQRWTQPAFEIQAVDTTAAGDAFTGYFIAGIYQNAPIPEVLKLASCAAAIAVSRHGAAPSIPYRQEVEQQLSSMLTKSPNAKEEFVRSALLQYISDNMQTATLQGFADTIEYSAVYTGSLVKKVTGMHFKQFLQQRRIRYAAELLLTTSLSVGEIVKLAGYENGSYFRKLFQKTYQQNPLQYRNNGGRKHDECTEN